MAGEAIGKKGRNDIIGAFTFGILAETEVEISAKVNYGEVVGGVVEIGGGNGKGGGELDFGEVAELEIFLFGGESDGKQENGLAIDGDAQAPVVEAEVLDGEWSIGLVTGQRAALDTIDEGEEVVAKIDGGGSEAERLELFVSEAFPSEGNVDPREREDRGEGIVGGVESEVFDGSTLKFGIRFTRGLGAEANIGKKEWGGIAEAERGRRNAGSEIIELES